MEDNNVILLSVTFSRKAVEVIRNHNSSNEDQPLFLYVAFQSAHAPIMKPPQKYLDMYKNTRVSRHVLNRAGTVSVSIPARMITDQYNTVDIDYRLWMLLLVTSLIV